MIPIPIFENSVCAIKAESSLAKLIKESRVIIWDEIFSVHRVNIECVETTLGDLMDSDHPWGGKAVLLGWDPRQALPVIKRAGRAQIVKAWIQTSPLYPLMQEHKLKVNMRTDKAENEFSNYLLDLGEGKMKHGESEVQVQITTAYLVKDLKTLISETFPDFQNECGDKENLFKGTVYTPLNKDIRDINDMRVAVFPGDESNFQLTQFWKNGQGEGGTVKGWDTGNGEVWREGVERSRGRSRKR
ncbi:hypothetical protein SKAU_G00095390 [Synaphobranchus kaupii]|uniref:ATP-dependent DNA helicase n=1 Tax=Synaphobranchus kaupii TaxID=118154 RepID=A0A9Q1J6V6_SYNKA|nr:hypothetical protein SKAU_G00095390 [Synaphobranchus kaupii]